MHLKIESAIILGRKIHSGQLISFRRIIQKIIFDSTQGNRLMRRDNSMNQ